MFVMVSHLGVNHFFHILHYSSLMPNIPKMHTNVIDTIRTLSSGYWLLVFIDFNLSYTHKRAAGSPYINYEGQ